MTNENNSFNLVVIGGGSAGLVSSYIAAAVKARVVLIERNEMGGDCLNTGCVPSKALIKTSRVVQSFRDHKKYGIKSASFELDFAEVMARVHASIEAIKPHDSIERYESLGVECIKGQAEIIDSHHVRVNGKILKTKAIVLALGASPIVPNIPGLRECSPLTSENLWQLKTLPKRLLIMGGGPIGCEMAQAFGRLGSEVTLVDLADRILAREDPDVSAFTAKRFEREGISLRMQRKAVSVKTVGQDKFLICEGPGGIEDSFAFDEILVAVGRRANTDGFNWKALGIELRKDGTIQVDARMRANGKNIYACGDVTGPYQFTHVSAHQAWYCAVNALFSPIKSFKVDYRVIPRVTFTDPEIAQVGHTERTATEAGLAFEKTLYGIDDLDRAIAENADEGFVKVLTQPGKDKLLGVTIVGSHAGEMLLEFTSAMKMGFGLNAILGTIHPYPTFGEANKYVAGNWKKAHAPQGILALLRRFFAWRRS